MSSGPQLHWQAVNIAGSAAIELFEMMRLRIDVFVVEQQCAYPELDDLDLDGRTLHVTGRDGEGRLVAYCRVIAPGADGLPHIGRVVVAPAFRARGHGRELMLQAIRIAERFNVTASAVAAQEHLRRFYERLGYRATGPGYLMDGIPHLDMVRRGTPASGPT